MRIKIIPIKLRKGLPSSSKLDHAIDEMLAEAALEAQDMFKKTTSTWQTHVNFTVNKTKYGRTVGTRSAIYKYVDQGTRSHMIYPRRKRILRFQTGYRAKTRPGVIGSSSGGASGGVVWAKAVRHPGTQARRFSVTIGERMGKRTAAIMRAKLKRIL